MLQRQTSRGNKSKAKGRENQEKSISVTKKKNQGKSKAKGRKNKQHSTSEIRQKETGKSKSTILFHANCV